MNCSHAPGKGMCRECAPSMFPTAMDMVLHELWFARYHKRITLEEYHVLRREMSARVMA